MPSHSPKVQHIVTAVIVAHDGAAWIPHVARAVRNQTRPLDRVVAVDTGSRDRSGAMLAEAFGRGVVFGMDRTTGYAAAIHQALRHRAASSHVPPVGSTAVEQVEWLWLLHDDCEPETDALERLLAGVSQAPAVAVAGPKVMDFTDRRVLLEAGFTIDRAGRRVTGIEPREVDHGQHDGDRDVVAVGSAGMLVRRDVWERVGGFDPGMRLYREDIDFCWRVIGADYRVRVITDAIVYHAEAVTRNRRRASAAPRRARQDRRNGLLVLSGNLPLLPMLRALAANLVLSLLRTAFFLVAKRPRAALDEVSAYLAVAGSPLRLMAMRRRRAHGRRAAYSRLRPDLPPGRSLRRLAEYASVALSRSHQGEMVGSHHATDDPSEDDSLLVDSGVVQRLLTNPGVLTFIALTLISLVAERSLLAATPLAGGALVPAWGGASDLWREYLQAFHPVGIGSSASAPPYLAVLAALATVLGGKPWLAVDVIVIGCVPLAGLTAYLATRRITSFVPARVWAALAYALLPVGMGAVAAGRLGTAVVLVLLPLAGVSLAGTVTRPRRRARRAAWASALIITVGAAFVPLVWLLVVVVVVAGWVAFGRRRPGSLLNAGIVVAVPMLVLLPWSAGLLTHPSAFLLQAGINADGLSQRVLPARSLLLLSPGGPGLPPFWVTGGLAFAAIVALLVGSRRRPVLAGWGAALIGLAAAGGASRVLLRPADGGTAIPAWPGAALALAGAGLVLAAAVAGDSLPRLLGSGRWRRPAGLAGLLVAVVACSAPALAAASWVVTGVRGPVGPSGGQVLPEIVTLSSGNGLRLRTLVLRQTAPGLVDYSVLRASDPPIGAPEEASPPAAQHALGVAVARLTAPAGGQTGDQGRVLASFGIGYVLMPAPVSARLGGLLDSVPGLRLVSKTATFELWEVMDTVAQVTVVEPDGKVVPVDSGTIGVTGAAVPASGGTLLLAEPAGGWSASVNGRPLTPLAAPVNGWEQGFRLPPGGGTLTIGRSGLIRDLAVGLELLAVLAVAALALPGARVAGEADEEAAAARHGRTVESARESEEGPERGVHEGRHSQVPALAAAAVAPPGRAGLAPAGAAGAREEDDHRPAPRRGDGAPDAHTSPRMSPARAEAASAPRRAAGSRASGHARGAATGSRSRRGLFAGRRDRRADVPERGEAGARRRGGPGADVPDGPAPARRSGRGVDGGDGRGVDPGEARGLGRRDGRGVDPRDDRDSGPLPAARGPRPSRADAGTGRDRLMGPPGEPGRGDGPGWRPGDRGSSRPAPGGPPAGWDDRPGGPPAGWDAPPGYGRERGGSPDHDDRAGRHTHVPDRGPGGRGRPVPDGRALPRSRVPADDSVLPPLPPPPPRSGRPRRPLPDYRAADGEELGWDQDPPDVRGESDW